MGQGDVVQFLEENKGKWFSAKQIARKLGVTDVNACLRKLRERGEVKSIKEKPQWRGFRYSI